MKTRTSSNSSKPPRKRIRSISVKRQAQLNEYAKERKKFRRTWPLCQVCGARKSWDIHHVEGRAGDRLLNQDNWLAVCRECHDLIHRNPKWAYEMGYLRLRK